MSNLSSAMCIEFNGKFVAHIKPLEKLMSEDLMRGEESVHRQSETFNLESDFRGNISVSEDRPLQMEHKLSMTEFYLSQKNGRSYYREMTRQDLPVNILTKSISFVKE